MNGCDLMEDKLEILKALGDKTRLSIIDLLLHYDFCVGAIARKLDLTEAAVSQHLQVLRKSNIVIGEKRGYYMHYDINKKALEELGNELIKIANTDIERKECDHHETKNHNYCDDYAFKE